MSIRMLAAGLVASGAFVATPAAADGHTDAAATAASYYVASRVSFSAAKKTDFAVGALGIQRVSNDYATDFMGVVGIGYAAGNGIRAEIEVSYANYDIGTHSAFDPAGARTNFTPEQSFGEARSLAVMASGYYDFENGTAFTPFVGAGIGYGQVKAEGFGVTPLVGALPGGVALSDSDTGIAYQFTVGAALDFTEKTKLEFGYRYQGIAAELASVTGAADDFDLRSHNLFAGLRFSF